MKKENEIYGVDWGHKDENQEWYSGYEEFFPAPPKLKKGDIILIENPPTYKAKEWYEKGIKLLTCHTMSSKEHRAEMGFPRLHH